MMNRKFLTAVFTAVICVSAVFSYAALPASVSETPQRTQQKAVKKKTSNQLALSFTLFQKLYSMSANEIVQYLKRRGCNVKYDSYCNNYSAKVRGGSIVIFPTNYKSPRLGIGAIQFITSDPNVRNAWYKGLAKAGYNNEGDEIWCGDTGHWPCFGVRNMIGYDDIREEINGDCILYIQAFPMKYNEKTGTYE